MYQTNYDKYKQIDKRLSIVQSACVLFASAICFKALFYQIDTHIYSWIYCFSMLVVLIGMNYLWNLVVKVKGEVKGKVKSKVKYFLENALLGSIIFFMILITGNYTSPYKFLFLIIIITSTIQLGKKYGMTMASIVSVGVLGIDLIYGPNQGVNFYFENDLILVGIFLLTAWVLGVYVAEEQKHIKELQEMVNYDGLTAVYNHRYFYEKLKQWIDQAKESKTSVGLLFLDIDYFKVYNDLNGHQAGDEILRQIGNLLKEEIGEIGVVARYGGEEFAIILPNYNHKEACVVAEEIRKLVEGAHFKWQENQPEGNLTISIGVSSYPDKAKDEIQLVKSADDALYRAKFFDKNRVETYSSVLDELEKNIGKKESHLIGSLKTLIGMINIKDRYTYGHSERVVLYSKLIAEGIGLNEKDTQTLVCGAYIHDIGKINIDEDILIKKMPLTTEEWMCLKEHPEKGVEVIQYITCLQDTKEIIRHHHERFDGRGYPDGLKGEEIPYLARVLTVIDSFDAMTSNRTYNQRKSYREAIQELNRCKGTQFDPYITEKFIEVFRKKNGSKL